MIPSGLLLQGTERAMMSTTTSMAVAIFYSQHKSNVRIVFKIPVGAVDRPASLQAFSQYPRSELTPVPPAQTGGVMLL